MKAPVATNRWNLALATKNTSSGPSSVTSLNIGCGWVLSISFPVLPSSPAKAGDPVFRSASIPTGGAAYWMPRWSLSSGGHSADPLAGHDEKNLQLNPRNRLREIACGERREIVDAFTDADEVHRQFEFLRQRHQNAAARGAVEFCHDEPGDPSGTMKRFDLRQRILSHRGIEHQQHRMRRRGIDLLDDAHDLFQFVHQLGLVLQPAGGIDQQYVALLLSRGRQRREGKARRIRSLRARDDRGFGALAPDFQLLDRGRAKRIAGGQHYLAALGGKFRRKLADGRGLAGTVDADHVD